MDFPSSHESAAESRPRTATVIGLIAAATLVASYLVAYAFTSALVVAEIISPIAPGYDPRPKLFFVTFACLGSAVAVLLVVFRWLSERQMQKIDEMNE